jgi:hypothetical protein
MFREMYHPNIPSTIAKPALVAEQAIDDQAALGWLLVDPGATLPDPVTPYYTKEALLSQITGGAAPIGTAMRAAYVSRNPVVTVTSIDADGNLLAWTEDGVAHSATYDPATGNVATMTVAGITRTYIFDADNNLAGAT